MFVCDRCVDEEALKALIRDNAEATRCDFCEREEETAIACDVDDFFQWLKEGFDVDWDDALNFMPVDGGDWAIPGAQLDIWELLDWFQIDFQDDLRDAVIRQFDNETFAPRYFFGASQAERLKYGWNRFVDFVTHHSRYLFLTTPMFYAARERETALRETASGGHGLASYLTLATFETGSGFNVLDLAELPDIPSVFDPDRRHLIEPLRFLHLFVDEVRKPIRRDEQEHLEYVPTQIVAEYLRHLYEQQTGERVDGIAYKSVIAANGSNVVLFIKNDACADNFGGDDVRKVKLTGFEHLPTELRAVARPRAVAEDADAE